MNVLVRAALFSAAGLGAAHLHPGAREKLQATAELLRAEVGQAFRALDASAKEVEAARPDEREALAASVSPSMADAMPGFERARALLSR